MAQRPYDHEQWARQQLREQQRQQRAELAAEKAAEREQKQAAVAEGKARAELPSLTAARKLERLTSILHQGLDRSASLDLARLIRRDQPMPLDLGSHGEPTPSPRWEDYAPPDLVSSAQCSADERATSGGLPRHA